MAEKQILGFAIGGAPRNRKTKDSERFALLAVNATFDGSSASADFLPTVVVISDSGDVVARCVADDVIAAGDSAEVTFAPFLENARGDIRFNKVNRGNWFYLRGDVDGGPINRAVFIDSSARMLIAADTFMTLVGLGSVLLSGGATGSSILIQNGIIIQGGGGGLSIGLNAGTFLSVFDSGNNKIFQVDEDGDLHGKTGKALTFDL